MEQDDTIVISDTIIMNTKAYFNNKGTWHYVIQGALFIWEKKEHGFV